MTDNSHRNGLGNRKKNSIKSSNGNSNRTLSLYARRAREADSQKRSNHNKTVDKKRNSVDKSKRVDLLADRLGEVFKSPEYRSLYCKIAYQLPEPTIWGLVEKSFESCKHNGRDPGPLFTFLCRKAGVE